MFSNLKKRISRDGDIQYLIDFSRKNIILHPDDDIGSLK